MRAEEETAAEEEAAAEEAAVAAAAGRVNAVPPIVTLTAARTTISLRTFLPFAERSGRRICHSCLYEGCCAFLVLREDPRRDFAKS
jgi:hypothetical protein